MPPPVPPQEKAPRAVGGSSSSRVVAGATGAAAKAAAPACRTQTVVQTAPAGADGGATGLRRKYDVGEMLGRGNFATVYAGLERESGRSVAVKVISKSRIKMLAPGRELMVYDEVRILRRLDHPHIIKVLDVFDTDAELSVVLELFVSFPVFFLSFLSLSAAAAGLCAHGDGVRQCQGR